MGAAFALPLGRPLGTGTMVCEEELVAELLLGQVCEDADAGLCAFAAGLGALAAGLGSFAEILSILLTS